MNRRENDISGWVRFPVDSPKFNSTNEGGIVVKLIVIDNNDINNTWSMCCGESVFDLLGECLIGGDKGRSPDINQFDTYDEYDKARREFYKRFYPRFDNVSSQEQFLSVPLLAAIALGTTGWSGFDFDGDNYWRCTFDDLTCDGKALYRQMEKLYPGRDIHLLTFLDT